MSNREVNETTKVFLRAKQRLATPDKHMQNAFVRDGRMCFYAALFFSDDDIAGHHSWSMTLPDPKVLDIVLKAIAEFYPHTIETVGNDTSAVCIVNNTKGFEAVHKVLDRCITMSMTQ